MKNKIREFFQEIVDNRKCANYTYLVCANGVHVLLCLALWSITTCIILFEHSKYSFYKQEVKPNANI